VIVSIVGTNGVPAQYGGFETLVENLLKNKMTQIEYVIFCSAKLYKQKMERYLGAKLRYINLRANGVASIVYDLICMLLSLHADVMLVFGVSGSLFLPFIRLIYRGKIITNIDGIEWRREKWNKFTKYYLRISEKFAIKFSDVIIGDNQKIVEYINERYKKESILIEYGGDHVVHNENKKNDEFYAITVCRIEPENNIHLILEAFSRQTKMSVVVVGNWKNSRYGLFLLKKYSNFSQIQLLDAIYDFEKINSLRSNAFMYVHGHSAGGTNPSLIEAMFLELPIFAYNCEYNKCTTENQCYYWSNIEDLYEYIIKYEELELNSVKEKMKNIANRRYKWENIVVKYEKLFFDNFCKNP